jgi:mitochondrial division protein 1
VEDHICLTGGEDGNVRLWDLRRIDEDEWGGEGEMVSLSDVAEEDESRTDGESTDRVNGIRSSTSTGKRDDACARLLEGHSKAVTALYFEDDCLVSIHTPTHNSSLFTNYIFRHMSRSQVHQTRHSDNGI